MIFVCFHSLCLDWGNAGDRCWIPTCDDGIGKFHLNWSVLHWKYMMKYLWSPPKWFGLLLVLAYQYFRQIAPIPKVSSSFQKRTFPFLYFFYNYRIYKLRQLSRLQLEKYSGVDLWSIFATGEGKKRYFWCNKEEKTINTISSYALCSFKES